MTRGAALAVALAAAGTAAVIAIGVRETPAPPPAASPAHPEPEPEPQIEIDVEPPPSVVVTVEARGMTPAEVERLVVYPLEVALQGVRGVDGITTVSRADVGTCTVTFHRGTDPYDASRRVVEALADARSRLPEDADLPLVSLPARRAPVARFVLSGERTGAELRAMAEEVRMRLLQTPGVVDVRLCGGREPRLLITPDPARLAALGLSPGAVGAAVAGAVGSHDLIGIPAIDDIGALGDAIVRDGVRLADVATVRIEGATPDCVAIDAGGEVVTGAAFGRVGAEPPDLGAALDDARLRLPVGVTLRVEEAPPSLVTLKLPPGTTAAATLEAARKLAPQAAPWLATADLPDGPVTLMEWPGDAPTDLLRAAAALPGARVTRVEGLARTLTLRLTGDDREALARAADAVAAAAPPPVLLATSLVPPLAPTVNVQLDRARLARLGLRMSDVRDAARPDLVLTTVRVDGRPMPVVLHQPAALDAATVLTPDGAAVPLTDVATITHTAEPTATTTANGRPSADVALHIPADADPAAARAAISKALRDLLSPGITATWAEH